MYRIWDRGQVVVLYDNVNSNFRINIKSWLSPRFGLGRVSSQNRDRNRDVVESRVPVQGKESCRVLGRG